MRKKERIKGYLPVFVGGMYLYVLDVLTTYIGVSISDYKVIYVGLLVVFTVASCMVLEQGIDLFDKNNANGNEEEED